MTTSAITAEQLYGTWRLVRAVALAADGQELPPPYGPVPMGRIVLTREGRMMAVLSDGRPHIPAGQKRAYASYCGNFRIENGQLITTVDAALIPERVGGQQVRGIEFRGEELVLLPPRCADGSQRELFWTLDGPP